MGTAAARGSTGAKPTRFFPVGRTCAAAGSTWDHFAWDPRRFPTGLLFEVIDIVIEVFDEQYKT